MHEYILTAAVYIYTAYCLTLVAGKTNTQKWWYAWLPVLNLYLAVKIAGKPRWWLIPFLVPFLNIIVGFFVYREIALRLGKPWWLGIVMVVPFINLIGWGYLAFSGSNQHQR